MAQQWQAMSAERKTEERRSPSPIAQKRPQSPSSSASSSSGGAATPAKQPRLDGENPTINTSMNSDGSPPKGSPVAQIKAKGTYYPLTAFPTKMPQGAVMRRDPSPPRDRTSGSSGKRTIHLLAALVAMMALSPELTSAPFPPFA
jgi:hypothetical protein